MTLPLSILHVYAPSEAGGLDRVVEGLSVGQRRLGHDVAVRAIHLGAKHEVPAIARMRAAGVSVHETVVRGRAYAEEWRSMVRLCREIRPHVVHTHGARCDVVDGLAARSVGVATVTTLHGRTGGGLKWRLFEWLQHRAIRRFDGIVAVSQPQLRYLLAGGFAAAGVHLIPNAWSPVGEPISRDTARARLGALPDVPLIGWVGRLSPEKGADVLIDALASLRDLALQVAVIGDGAAADMVKARARTLGVERAIRWHGTIPDAAMLFRAFDVFVLSSRTEGTPIALFEAMAASVPIVATAVGGVPAVVSSDDALLVASEDPLALATAIRTCLSDPGAAAGRATRATLRLAEAYGTEGWLSRHDQLYRNLIAMRVRLGRSPPG